MFVPKPRTGTEQNGHIGVLLVSIRALRRFVSSKVRVDGTLGRKSWAGGRGDRSFAAAARSQAGFGRRGGVNRALCFAFEEGAGELPDLVEDVGELVVGVEEVEADVGVADGEFAGEGGGDDGVVEAVDEDGGLGEIGEVVVLAAVFDDRVAEVAGLAVGVVEDGEEAGAAPVFQRFFAEFGGEAGGEAEGGGEEEEAFDVGVAGGVEGGEVAAEAGADEDGLFAGGGAVDDGELAGEGEVLEVALGEVGDVEGDAVLAEALLEVAGFGGSGAAGEAVEVDVAHGVLR